MNRPQPKPSLASRIYKAGLPEVWDKLAQAASRFEPDLQEAFLSALAQARQGTSSVSIEAALRAGNVELVVQLLLGGLEVAPAFWGPMVDAARAAVTGSALQFTLDMKLPGLAGPGPRLVTRFDQANPKALASIRRYELDLIREVDHGTREGIREYVRASLEAGRNPRTLIPQLAGRVGEGGIREGGIIGLTARQSRAVSNYRRALEEGDLAALNRQLRDKRHDPTVQRAIEEGRPLSKEQIDQMVGRYESNYLAYRAETISRTESMRALSSGQKLAWDAVIDGGKISRGRLVKTWVTARDERVRDEHREMEGVTIDYDEQFEMPNGDLTWGPPYDPNCRCVAFIKPMIRRVI